MAMERFIRQKYERRAFQDGTSQSSIRHDSGSSGSDHPPPLPPKPEQRFALGGRAVSSTFPMSTHTRNEYMSQSFTLDPPKQIARLPSPLKRNKQSQVFGASVGNGGEDMGTKLSRLREMGFADEAMNARALKSSNGSLERAVETIMVWGDGIARQSSGQAQDPANNQVKVKYNGVTSRNPVTELGSRNPFDRVATQPPQSLTSSTGVHMYGAQKQSNGNFAPPQQQNQYPVGVQPEPSPLPPQLQQQPNSQFFSNTPLPQPLFPHATGGLTTNQQQEVLRRQAFTPPVPSIPQRQYLYGPSHPFISNHTNANPFLAQPSALLHSTQQQPEVSSLSLQGQVHPTPVPSAVYTTPAPLVPLPTGRADKASIMALFSQPHLAPLPPPPSHSNLTPARAAGGESLDPASTSSSVVPTNPRTNMRSVSSPLAGSRNPFSVSVGEKTGSGMLDAQAGGATRIEAARHSSQESVDVGSWANGRHSPDAFANLSARFVS